MSKEVVFSHRSRGDSDPSGKPRVYFTCHPEDFARYFEKICGDILKAQDCAIYYTDDMTADLSHPNNQVDLERMNLFVIPVTFRLLTQPNRAMDKDFRFATEKHIPVLPLMMESGIDEFYGKPDKFGELQYLEPFSRDLTAISYEEKLKKYLGSVLISNELAQRVRKAFDAYIFLSYRKKDRAHANELMKLIHQNPEYRDIAIWFDEFLTPGESFEKNIEKILADSKLFTLLVTPNLLERPNGKPNVVMAEEYPAAMEAGKDILPAEMEKTDRKELEDAYKNIPEPVDANDEGAFRARLADSLAQIAVSENNNDPEHNYLIGLAYLEGIDVEVNAPRGLELITSAGEAELPEAMDKLYRMYDNGDKVPLDYRRALYWIEKLADYFMRTLGEEHLDTLAALHNLAYIYGKVGDYQRTLKLQEKVYILSYRAFGEKNLHTLRALGNLAITYGNLGDHPKALELGEKVYALRCKVCGEEHPDTLTSLNNLAITCVNIGDYQQALKLGEKGYSFRRKVLGEEHPDTLTSLNNLAYIYGKVGDYQKALELQ